jgi:hypothetical protein
MWQGAGKSKTVDIFSLMLPLSSDFLGSLDGKECYKEED